MTPSRELIRWCRAHRNDTELAELLIMMEQEAVTRFTAARPDDTQEMLAARHQYDAVIMLGQLIQNYGQLDDMA